MPRAPRPTPEPVNTHARAAITPASAPQGPPKRLAVRIAFYVVAVVLLTAFASTYALTQVARGALLDAHARSVEVFSQALTASLSRQLDDGWSPSAQAAIEGFEFDPRTAFIEVFDPQGEVLQRRVIEPKVWQTFQKARPRPTAGELGLPMKLGGEGAILAQVSPIWNPPLRVSADRPTADSDRRRLVGFVALGLHDHSLPGVLGELFWAELAVAGGACGVFLPLAVWGLMRWLAPLRRLAAAVGELSEGRRPEPIPDHGQDELGLLARAFNAMVERLFQAHAALEAANQHLEGEVARRTVQLRAANDRLEAEARDKDDFLRAVTHDLGAPVRNITGLASMLIAKHQHVLTEDAIRKLDRINANARHQTELIHDLLELSRIRTRPGRSEWFELGDVIHQLREAFSFELEKAGIELRLLGDMPRLYAERNRVRQVFQNLLDNAIKYMLDAETREIVIEHRQDDHTHFFAVTDTGRGIAKEDLGDVFQMFRRSLHSGTDRVAGRGVGLASVKTIIEAYEGTITVASELGRGTRFDFTLAKSAVSPVRNSTADDASDDKTDEATLALDKPAPLSGAA